ncbi:ABC transporter ATP-binding protein [Zhihengliuella flava]|uniref:ABC transport system ATP-binding protein n=1 Tax=Zhihengliuella flava TaxID=1285193 RepID=A0A931D9V7_9MICC|nr:ABC transporter ATP-binding protein [Zhihengliuella flava]MBG6083581.1 putative ABC transport system ATP-binding protein [Zhihengliuella flava]
MTDAFSPSTPIPTGSAPAVSARGLTKVYGQGETQVRALDGIDIDFPAERFTAIMGPSGSGKSTLMHCLAGLDTATSGQVFISGQDLTSLNDAGLTRLRRDKVGFIFQSFNLVPTLTAEQNIVLPLDLAGTTYEQAWFDRVIGALGLETRLRHKPHQLSGGQQQRVAVARALLTRPDVVFGDEPTGNLDSATGAEVLSFLQASSRDFGQSIIMVTHDPVAASYADHVVLVRDGGVVGRLDEPSVDSVTAALAELSAGTSTPAPRRAGA